MSYYFLVTPMLEAAIEYAERWSRSRRPLTAAEAAAVVLLEYVRQLEAENRFLRLTDENVEPVEPEVW